MMSAFAYAEEKTEMKKNGATGAQGRVEPSRKARHGGHEGRQGGVRQADGSRQGAMHGQDEEHLRHRSIRLGTLCRASLRVA